MEPKWEFPVTQPLLMEGMIHVWRLNLAGGETSRPKVEALLQRAYAALSDGERERAARMRQGAPREEFVAGRGCLRTLLATETGQAPQSLTLEVGACGKPRLRGADKLAFNVAHSQGMVLIALSRAGAVGVDVEAVNRAVEAMELAAAALHPADVARIAAADEAERVEVFYRCWARREAVAKADGRGLTAPAKEWEVGSEGCEVGEFLVQDLTVGKLHRAALAARRPHGAVRQLDFNRLQFTLLQ